MNHDAFLTAAIEEARKGLASGGIPIGSVLVIDGTIVGRGHNQRVQQDSAIRHAEMDCLENAGRLSASVYVETTLYSTLSPCFMCSGAIIQFGIPRLVVGGDIDFGGPREHLEHHGVEVIVLDDHPSVDLIDRFILEQPSVWYEDIGKVPNERGSTDPTDGL